jgi:hypothetical protein
MVMDASKDVILQMDCRNLKEFLGNKFGFCEEILNTFKGILMEFIANMNIKQFSDLFL